MAFPLTTTDNTGASHTSEARNARRPGQAAEACPLCGDSVPSKELRAHLDSDGDEIRRYVLSLIRNSNPEWVESDGACAKCLDYYSRL